MTKKQTEKDEAIKELRRVGVRPGKIVYTLVTHVAKSGMSRRMRLFVVRKGEVVPITYSVAKAVGFTLKRNGDNEIVVGGCGMDMGFHVVYSLGQVMFPKRGKAYRNRNSDVKVGGHEPSGGYLLRQEWL